MSFVLIQIGMTMCPHILPNPARDVYTWASQSSQCPSDWRIHIVIGELVMVELIMGVLTITPNVVSTTLRLAL